MRNLSRLLTSNGALFCAATLVSLALAGWVAYGVFLLVALMLRGLGVFHG